MCVRKAAGVNPLLQGLTKVQIATHSQFAAEMDFPAGPLARTFRQSSRRGARGFCKNWHH
jgi:hypothetical protein